MPMKVLVFLIVVGLIVVSVVVLPDLIGRPSEAAVEEAVLTYIVGLTPLPWPWEGTPLQWVQEVEVIAVGEPYKDLYGDRKCWPVKVYLIGGQSKEVALVYLYKDEFRQWRALAIQDIP